jgi:FKBP-type peptidyl-prolyl cis-trans isomerase SlyD
MHWQQMMSRMAGCVILSILLSAVLIPANAQEQASTVSTGMEIAVEYTLKLDDKAVFESNVGAEPLIYVQGAHQIVPGLEKALEGTKVGESKQVTVSPDEGYGTIDQEAFLEVEKARIPPEAHNVGATLQGQTASGEVLRARVTEVKDSTVVLDFNHPLAGKTLYFEVKILQIQQAPGK